MIKTVERIAKKAKSYEEFEKSLLTLKAEIHLLKDTNNVIFFGKNGRSYMYNISAYAKNWN